MMDNSGSQPSDIRTAVEAHAIAHARGAADPIQAFYDEYDATYGALATIVGNLVASVSTLQAQVPQIGSIMSWSGSVVSIPSNWQICDGTNGTPNLKDAFLYGAGGTKSPGASGGSDVQADHGHHNHAYTNANFIAGGAGLAVNPNVAIGNESATLSHGTNLPPYIALCFIMRIS